MKKALLSIILLSVISIYANAQGCVAIKGSGASCMRIHPEDGNKPGWQFSTSGRYFKSFRHFSGKEENKQRLIDNSEVINHTTIVDMTLTRVLNSRWSFMIDVPVINNGRSSLYEHGLVNGTYIKKERHSTHSFGVGDIRLAAYHWLLDPAKNSKGNIQVGLGISCLQAIMITKITGTMWVLTEPKNYAPLINLFSWVMVVQASLLN